MGLNVNNYSRFSDTPTIIFKGNEVWGRWKRNRFLTQQLTDDQLLTYIVPKNREGRPDLISQDVYNTTELDWLIISFNKANQVFNWPKVGTILVLPIPGIVAAELL